MLILEEKDKVVSEPGNSSTVVHWATTEAYIWETTGATTGALTGATTIALSARSYPNGEVVLEMGIPPVPPGSLVQGHCIFPLSGLLLSWVVAENCVKGP